MEKEFPAIETSRLTLREVTIDEAKDLYTYLSDHDVVKPMGLEPFETEEDVCINLYTKKGQVLDGESH